MEANELVNEVFRIIENEGSSIKELSEKTNKTKQYYYDLKRRKNVSISELQQILDVFGYTTEFIFVKHADCNQFSNSHEVPKDIYDKISEGYLATKEMIKYLKQKNKNHERKK